MLAFNNDPVKAEVIRQQVLAHQAADEIVQDDWENGKGGFIGCIVHGDSIDETAIVLGCHPMLVGIADSIFENLPNAEAKQFPARVVLAPKVGADLSLVPWKFLHWLVEHSLIDEVAEMQIACAKALAVLRDKAAGREVSAECAYDAYSVVRAADDVAIDGSYAGRVASHATYAVVIEAVNTSCTNRVVAAYSAYAVADAAGDRIKQAEKLIEFLKEAE